MVGPHFGFSSTVAWRSVRVAWAEDWRAAGAAIHTWGDLIDADSTGIVSSESERRTGRLERLTELLEGRVSPGLGMTCFRTASTDAAHIHEPRRAQERVARRKRTRTFHVCSKTTSRFRSLPGRDTVEARLQAAPANGARCSIMTLWAWPPTSGPSSVGASERGGRLPSAADLERGRKESSRIV